MGSASLSAEGGVIPQVHLIPKCCVFHLGFWFFIFFFMKMFAQGPGSPGPVVGAEDQGTPTPKGTATAFGRNLKEI